MSLCQSLDVLLRGLVGVLFLYVGKVLGASSVKIFGYMRRRASSYCKNVALKSLGSRTQHSRCQHEAGVGWRLAHRTQSDWFLIASMRKLTSA